MRFYIGGKYEERHLVKEIAEKLVSMGFEWTCDWTEHTDLALSTNYAKQDIDGVLDADFTIFKKDNNHIYKGTWVEMGAALGNYIPVYVVGHDGDSCIFINHPLVTKFETFEELYGFLEGKYLK